MATKPSSARKSKKTTKSARTNKKTIVASRRSRLSSRPLAILAALLFGSTGIYLLVTSGALQSDEVLLADDPARGLVYHGKKVKTKGPCAGGFDITTSEDEKKDGKEKRRCAHYDPTPKGVDIRERVKNVDKNLEVLAEHDNKNKPAMSDDETSGYEPAPATAAAIWAGSMDGITARDAPCFGTGSSGARIQLIYVYPAGGTNRFDAVRPGLGAIARRMNSVFYHSGVESGNAHQIRFVTNHGDPGCGIRIAQEGIRGDELNDFSFIRARLAERGYKGVPTQVDLTGDGKSDYTDYVDRKYLIWIDKDTANCGLGEIRSDVSRAQTNSNNHSVSYAMVWKGCWNYAEPHEVMHMLGGVQGPQYTIKDGRRVLTTAGAPYSTEGHHCYDERDIMCYDDGPGVTLRNFCTRDIDVWRFDCRHDTYYRGNDPASGWLSNHWNTANSRFLTP